MNQLQVRAFYQPSINSKTEEESFLLFQQFFWRVEFNDAASIQNHHSETQSKEIAPCNKEQKIGEGNERMFVLAFHK